MAKKMSTLAREFYDLEINGQHLREVAFRETHEAFKDFDEDSLSDLSLEDQMTDRTYESLVQSLDDLIYDEAVEHPLIIEIRKLSDEKRNDFLQELHDNVWAGHT